MAKPVSSNDISRATIISYSDIRGNIQTGDFLFCSGTYPLSKMIMGATNSVWSHVGLIVRLTQFDRLFVLESVEDQGVRMYPLSNYLEKYEYNTPYRGYLVIASASQRINLTDGLDWGFERIGIRFDYEEIVKIAARIALGTGSHKSDEKFICSELVEAIWRISGYRISFDTRGFISPDNIWRDPIVGGFQRIH